VILITSRVPRNGVIIGTIATRLGDVLHWTLVMGQPKKSAVHKRVLLLLIVIVVKDVGKVRHVGS